MLQDLAHDDGDVPPISFVPAGVPWQDVQDHIKISHSPLLVQLEDTGEYIGVYWSSSRANIADDLGPDLDEAVQEFREYLRDHGEV
ncbi:MAG: hypothetical protein ABJB47_13625 [Actinomycetota bacterium]